MSAKMKKLPEQWNADAPWIHFGAIAYDPEKRLYYSVAPDGQRYLFAMFETPLLVGADDSTVSKIKSALSAEMPAGSFIQFHNVAHIDIEKYVAAYEDGKEKAHPVIRRMVEKRAEMILQGKDKPLFRGHPLLMERRLFITCKVPISDLSNAYDLDLVEDVISRVEGGLAGVGFQLAHVEPERYLWLMRKITHPFHRQTYKYDKNAPLKEQIFHYGDTVEFQRNTVEFSNSNEEKWYANLVSVKYFPEYASLAIANHVIGSPFGVADQIELPHVISLTLHYPDQLKKSSDLQWRYAILSKQVVGPIASMFPELVRRKQGMDVLIDSATKESSRYVEMNFSVWLYGRTPHEVNRHTDSLTSYFASLGFDARRDAMILEPMFHTTLPGEPYASTMKGLFRFHTMTVPQAIQFIPLIGDWSGSGPNGVQLLTGRRGNPVLFDLFESSTNFNGLIFAESGSGKSVFANELIKDYLAEGGRVWVVDMDYSYYKLCHLVGGLHIDFSKDSKICLNPFTHIVNLEDDIHILISMFAKMASPQEDASLSQLEISTLEKAISYSFEKFHNKADVDAVVGWLMSQPDDLSKDLAKRLFSYTSDGMYGSWFNGVGNLNLDNQFVVLEMKGLADQPNLQKVVLTYLMSRVAGEMYSVRTRGSKGRERKLFVMDESWQMLDDPMMSKAVEGMYRKVRKNDGSALIITQSLLDLDNFPSGTAIRENTSWYFILQQKPDAVEAAIERGVLSLSNYEAEIIKSLRKVDDKFSEIMIRNGSGTQWGVTRLILDPFSVAVYSSKGAARNWIINEIKKGRDPVEVIEDYLEKKEAGYWED